jgi:hypothetical protein
VRFLAGREVAVRKQIRGELQVRLLRFEDLSEVLTFVIVDKQTHFLVLDPAGAREILQTQTRELRAFVTGN